MYQVLKDLEDSYWFDYIGVLVVKHCRTFNLDHAVLVVGYGTDVKSGFDYWLVKNRYLTKQSVKFGPCNNVWSFPSAFSLAYSHTS